MILLISLMLLTLFLLLGTTYMLTASARRPCTISDTLAGSTRRIAEEIAGNPPLFGGPPWDAPAPPAAWPNPGTPGQVEDVLQWHRETARAEAINRYLAASLLHDKHGHLYRDGRLNSISRMTDTAIPFFMIVAQLPANADPVATREPYAGRILVVRDSDEANAAFRIVSAKATGDAEMWQFLAHPVNLRAPPDVDVLMANNAAAGGPSQIVILGREFSGDPANPGERHESWDAPDARNLFLSWVQEEAALGRDGIPDPRDAGAIARDVPEKPWRYVVPSFHRPDHLLKSLKDGPSDLSMLARRWVGRVDAQNNFVPVGDRESPLLLRPMGKMEFHPDDDELPGRQSRTWTQAGFPARPTWQTHTAGAAGFENPDHPDFTGSNVTIIDGRRHFFDPINGPWDVDNDGDGIADSVWIDVGAPEVDINGQRCRPLVAMMIIDLDGRINLNVHGSLAEGRHGVSATTGAVASTGVRYGGLSANGGAVLPAGLGWGVAEISPRHVFARGFPNAGADSATGSQGDGLARLARVLVGGGWVAGLAGEQSPAGLLIPSLPAEGRYGDSLNLAGELAPSPGRRGFLDPPVDDPSAPPRYQYPPVSYGQSEVPLGSPVDPWGLTRVGVDQMGQPYFSRHPATAAPWEQDRIDTPYDMSVGRGAPKPGWSYDPDVPATGIPSQSFQDNLFTPSQLERVLRLHESGVEAVSPRLLSLLGSDVEKARLSVTTESWDSAAACVPWPVLNPLLALSDQYNSTKPSLISWDLQMGLKMDVNRPFGDGKDNNGNGVVDEPGEFAGERAQDVYGLAGTAFADVALTNGRRVKSGPGDADLDDQDQARQLYARHLFVLAMRAAAGLPEGKLTDYRREAAQWAVNVVDFRDSDSIMTRFQYDEDFGPDSTEWNVSESSPTVWGCERPELLLTEAMAWRNIEETGKQSDDTLNYNDTKSGGLLIEVYHPWTSMTSQTDVRGNPLPAEFMDNATGRYAAGDAGAINLAKRNEKDESVWQIVIVADDPASQKAMLENSAWPPLDDPAVKSIIYLGPQGPEEDDQSSRWVFRPGNPANLRPGQIAIIAGPGEGDLLPIRSQAGQQEGLTLDAKTGSIAIDDPLAEFVLIPSAGGAADEFTESLEYGKTDRLERGAAGRYRYPNDAPAATDDKVLGPVGAIVRVEPASGAGASTLTLPSPFPPTAPLPLAEFKNEWEQKSRFRILLRRLANPLEPFDSKNNPYLTIDASLVQDQGIILDNPGDPEQPNVRGTLRSTERAAAQQQAAGSKTLTNNLWRQDHAWQPWAAAGEYRGVKNCFRRTEKLIAQEGVGDQPPGDEVEAPARKTLEASLGFLPPHLRIPVPPADGEEPPPPAEGEEPPPHVPPFPWLTWLNRDFVSPHELLLVPKSSPSRLLRDHTHEWPFHHLFFGGGRLVPADAEADDADDADEAVDPAVWAARAGILEFLRVPSRFADAEQRVPPDDAVRISGELRQNGGNPLFLPPHNYLSHFREPGRVNLNTISSADVWAAVTGGQAPVPYEDEVHYVSRSSPPGFVPAAFVRSEDWELAEDDDPSAPFAGNWRLDPDEDQNGNGRLDLNHDSNNDGRQAGSRVGAMQSLAMSRRGWPLENPATTPIAGQFDRVLNRGGIDAARRWFDGAFQSGWAGGTDNPYDPEKSLLLRTTSLHKLQSFVRLSRDEGYGRLAQTGVNLTAGVSYTCRIEIRGNFTPEPGDAIPEIWQGVNTYLPSTQSRQYSAGTDTTTLVATLQVPTTSASTLSLSLWSQPSIDIRSVSLKTPDGVELLANGKFDAELASWQADGGSIAIMSDQGDDSDPNRKMPLFARQLGLPKVNGRLRIGRDYADPLRNPYFLYQDIVRLSNLVTPRSNVFAIWTTVGFFELDNRGRLGREYGLDSGSTVRHKAFQIIDRSIPVGYQPDGSFRGNSSDVLLYDHFTN